MKTYSYKDLLVWQKSMHLVKEIYALTSKLPQSEKYGIASQMQRAAVAIPCNLAEGHLRRHHKEFCSLLVFPLGQPQSSKLSSLFASQSIDSMIHQLRSFWKKQLR